ncbi:FecR family protein [Novosphingobium sp. 9]|uniref:FecR family protein n=1 Tax=Novosphingobium sp. 9 TaxID=2025349 RepID=UPI0021B627B2|nr:FecR domain-containing protein [Novosphingobium sp. 9]
MNEHMSKDQIIDEAADWADRLPELSEGEHLELAAWLEHDPRCRSALERMLRLLGDPALLDALDMPRPVVALLPSRSGSSRRIDAPPMRSGLSRRQALAAGLGAVLAVPVGWATLRSGKVPGGVAPVGPPLRFASATGQHREVSLPDGSTVLLDAASSVSIDFSGRTRRIALDGGAARFDVRHDPARPFEVHVPDARMTALGTRFSVERLIGAAELKVFEGAVRFEAQRQQALAVTTGHWALLDGARLTQGGGVGARADWQDEWLDAQDMPLSFALQRLGRYTRAPIRLDDPALAQARFSGRFRLDNPQASLALIGALFGLEAVPRDGAIHLRSA